MSGRIGSIFTPQDTPAFTNFFIAVKIEVAGGVPGSTNLRIFSLHVVIDQTRKQLSLYFSCSSKSLSIILDFVRRNTERGISVILQYIFALDYTLSRLVDRDRLQTIPLQYLSSHLSTTLARFPILEERCF